ncbi:hypothetical protein SOASR030_00670 [Leminorella grimontii]|uniref:IS1 family transposase n=3 Tax=Leminorella grimontii TaxID=82981 RepID=A0AAV5MVT6_9GAMM|nr:hypothetical protein SOASR030_00670 [Leminorella grimontii]GKX60296.1 hypothetical protein SOASR031_26110 [Leminorella grimontii]
MNLLMDYMHLLKRKEKPACRHCGLVSDVRLHGKAKSGMTRYRCMACKKSFQLKYIYGAYKE